MCLTFAFLLIILASGLIVEAQSPSARKNETDLDRREIVGRVNYVRIRRKLIKSTYVKGFKGGWIPSLTI